MAKEVDRARTLEKYIDRISRMDDEAFRVFDNAMIGTFELYSTRHNVEAGDHMDRFCNRLASRSTAARNKLFGCDQRKEASGRVYLQ